MRPHFQSLDELLAHTKGKGWAAVVAEFQAEYGSFDLTKLPQKQRSVHPLLAYDDELRVLYHFLSSTPYLPTSSRDKAVLAKLERTREAEGGSPPV
jgi:hypothetical protein